ncbi:MAG: polysaccharide deacetylase family protein [Eubacteriales bacterium]|nr:polysaccharide deacetylase family protein [Eubacteriales bacterium]MDD3198969.1 polysaccharide deacetylase family protein [Eubacteriales bacterium]MDD4629545.1 polysaccharide deacetylase family protein [Eubacteriales bacterium]
MKTSKFLIFIVFTTVFVIFTYQIVTLGMIVHENYSAMKNEGVQILAPNEEGVVIRSGLPNSGQLTFSCNVDWGEGVIPDLLRVLRENQISITFFVSGKWAENNRELLKEMYAAGHEIQSHGYSHKLSSQNSVETIKEEILKTEKVIIDILGVKTNVFAPPSGDYDETTVELCRSLGYKMALWSADTIDWREGSTSEVIKNRILKKHLNGAIVLMHPKEETVKALPDLIKEIRAQDLEIVPLYMLSK